jgi:hypothetical protein
VGWIVYSLCALTATLSAVLLLQSYARSKYRLLFWSGVCFAGLAINNLLLVLDKLVLPDVDLSVWLAVGGCAGSDVHTALRVGLGSGVRR